MKNLLLLIAFTILQFSFFIGQVMAQTPVPGGGSTADAPLDGFSSMLLAAGVGYGVRKMTKKDSPTK